MRYGIPYKGSKNRIATWVVGNLPGGRCLVDLFAGGCAVTHAALLSGRWGHVIANDQGEGPQVFLDAVRGEYDGYATVPTRREFLESKDFAERLLNSFGNNRRDYLWSRALEPVKVAATRMLCAPSVHERRVAYKAFCHELAAYLHDDGDGTTPERKLTGSDDASDRTHGLQGLERLERLQGLQGLERLQGLEGLERLQGLERLEGLEVTRLDYRDVLVPYGSVVYADPPYRGTCNEAYDGDFDFDAFDAWLADVPFMVVTSEYTAPGGCVEVASRKRRCTAGTNNRGGDATERLFVQERFAGQYRDMMNREATRVA